MNKKRLIFILAVLLLMISAINFFTIFTITGTAVGSNSGTTSLCLNAPPTITAIADQSATAGTAFSLQIVATDNAGQSLSYYDNTSLFDISATGLISFTPSAAGTEDILITVQDSSACTNTNRTDTFTITIAAATEAPPTGGGGGGGGGAAPVKKAYSSFKLSEEIVKITLPQSESLEKSLLVTNNGDTVLEISVDNPIEDVMMISPEMFTLTKDQEQEVKLLFNSGQDTKPNIYSGLVSFIGTYKEERITQPLTVVAEIESEEVLFDASLDLPRKTLLPEEELRALVTLFNLRRGVASEVNVIYSITNLNNNVFYEDSELLTVDKQVSFTKIVKLTEDIVPGQYVFSIKLMAQDSFATATELFTIEPFPTSLAGGATAIAERPVFLLAIPVMILAIAVIAGILYLLHLRTRKLKGKTSAKDKVKVVEVDKSGLKRKLFALREGYKKGFIQEKSYLKAKRKLERMIRK